MSMDSKQPPSSPQVRALGEHFETALDRAARAAEPPDYDQLAAYVDGTLDDVDREIVESWLESDPALRAEAEDLRALHDAMSQPASAPTSAPAARGAGALSVAATASPAAGLETPSPSRPSSSVVSFEEAATRAGAGRGRRFGTATVIMGAMAAAVIAATTWMAVRTARVDDRRPGPGPGTAGPQIARQLPPEQQQQQQQPPQPPPPQKEQSQALPEQGKGQGLPPVQGPNGGVPAVAANPAGALAIRDAGGLISIDAAGTITGLAAEAATPQMMQLVADALTKGAVPRGAAAAGLGGRELTLMGSGRQPATTRLTPLSPIATVVRSTQPVFRWSTHPGARNYVVTIYGPDFDRVMASPVLTDTSWTATAPLKAGVTYQWQVTADTPDGAVRAPAPPAPDARFRVIDPAAAKTLDRDLRRAGASQLMKGLLLAQAGVLDEAEEAFQALHAANPDSKRIADLLARVRDRRLAP
jgi:hypothetical protein